MLAEQENFILLKIQTKIKNFLFQGLEKIIHYPHRRAMFYFHVFSFLNFFVNW